MSCWFEPTYEELKDYPTRLSSRWSKWFEPTYEELKVSNGQHNARLTMGFEPTYEELKDTFQLSEPNFL